MEITKWMEKVITCLKRGKPLAGRGIVIEETPLGSRIHAKAVSEGHGGGSDGVILELGTSEFNSELNRYVYKAVAYVDFDDGEGTICYAIPITEMTDIVPEGSLLLGFSNSYRVTDPNDPTKKLAMPMYIFDVPRWLDKMEP